MLHLCVCVCVCVCVRERGQGIEHAHLVVGSRRDALVFKSSLEGPLVPLRVQTCKHDAPSLLAVGLRQTLT